MVRFVRDAMRQAALAANWFRHHVWDVYDDEEVEGIYARLQGYGLSVDLEPPLDLSHLTKQQQQEKLLERSRQLAAAINVLRERSDLYLLGNMGAIDGETAGDYALVMVERRWAVALAGGSIASDEWCIAALKKLRTTRAFIKNLLLTERGSEEDRVKWRRMLGATETQISYFQMALKSRGKSYGVLLKQMQAFRRRQLAQERRIARESESRAAAMSRVQGIR